MKNTLRPIFAAAIILSATALTSCGSSSKTTSTTREPALELPKVPEVDPNRPKTGRAALFGVPWTPKDELINEKGFVVKNYIMITEDELKTVALCGLKIEGKWQWVKPEAVSQIRWGKDGKAEFTTTESDKEKGQIGKNTCSAVIEKDVTYMYGVQNNGETLGLVKKVIPPEPTEYEILRN